MKNVTWKGIRFQYLNTFKDMAQENFDRISRVIKKEVEIFDLQKTEDFKIAIMQYLEAMASSQEAITIQWENHLPKKIWAFWRKKNISIELNTL